MQFRHISNREPWLQPCKARARKRSSTAAADTDDEMPPGAGCETTELLDQPGFLPEAASPARVGNVIFGEDFDAQLREEDGYRMELLEDELRTGPQVGWNPTGTRALGLNLLSKKPSALVLLRPLFPEKRRRGSGLRTTACRRKRGNKRRQPTASPVKWLSPKPAVPRDQGENAKQSRKSTLCSPPRRVGKKS